MNISYLTSRRTIAFTHATRGDVYLSFAGDAYIARMEESCPVSLDAGNRKQNGDDIPLT